MLSAEPRQQELAPSLARTFNTAAPSAGMHLPPAAPFHFDAGPQDRDRAIDCLAAAAYYEAGREAPDQRAVVQVVLNRVRHAAFPSTICGVVFAGADRVTGCQFTFTCDGSLGRRRPSPRDWRDARDRAAEMLLGRVESLVGQATHYHTYWVAPPWDRAMNQLAVVNSHLFFGWRGAAGDPSAFGRRYRGGEPDLARLGSLSSPGKHLAGTTDPAPAIAHGEPQAREADDDLFLVALPGNASASFPRLAEERCGKLPDCRFIGWTDPARKARALPLPGASVDAISFTYVRRAGALGDARWNCSEFPREREEECLLRGT
ncbi:MAG: cell wall hydrolase [Novosphingobium lindaniclasticum]|jgi:hypothetical protein|nr:cell wall hydrolase [Novosphingobium lindaniclasticum]